MTRLALLLLAPLLLISCGRESAPEAEREQAQAAAPAAPSATPAPGGGPEADPASCVTYDNAYASAPLMRVRGAADSQVRFQDRAEACPATGACGWRRDGYVIGGDVVLASAEVNGFRCVYAGTAKGDLAAGFLPRHTHQAAETSIMLTLVAAGLGVALLPESVLALHVDGVRFVPVADDVHIDLALAWRREDRSPALARLLDALEANGFLVPDAGIPDPTAPDVTPLGGTR